MNKWYFTSTILEQKNWMIAKNVTFFQTLEANFFCVFSRALPNL